MLFLHLEKVFFKNGGGGILRGARNFFLLNNQKHIVDSHFFFLTFSLKLSKIEHAHDILRLVMAGCIDSLNMHR